MRSGRLSTPARVGVEVAVAAVTPGARWRQPGGPGTTASNPDKQSIRIEMAQGTRIRSPPGICMAGCPSTISNYNIYLDSTHHQVWGTGEGPTLAYVDSHPPNGTPVIVPAFGRIFGRQDVSWGPYTDTVPVRILF